MRKPAYWTGEFPISVCAGDELFIKLGHGYRVRLVCPETDTIHNSAQLRLYYRDNIKHCEGDVFVLMMKLAGDDDDFTRKHPGQTIGEVPAGH